MPHFVVIWAKHEPRRVGEIGRVPNRGLLGRSSPREPQDDPRIEFFRQRPVGLEPTGQLASPTLSRRQWRVASKGDTIVVRSTGKQRLLHNGLPGAECAAKPGDVVSVEGVISFLIEERPLGGLGGRVPLHAFGEADQLGMVGEHPGTWELRRVLHEVGASDRHVLVLGASGVGKELAARGVHLASSRAQHALVSRNAATIPASLVEAELFGHAANFPNAGMPARPGLIGSAHGTILFLDEIAELNEAQQANLLRVLDAGEYQRLGEDRIRHSDFRLIAATNRPPSELKHDFVARFAERIEINDFNTRRSDIPLLIEHLLRNVVSSTRCPSQALVEQLTRHHYTTNARELERLLRMALRDAAGDSIHPSSEWTLGLDLPTIKREPGQGEVREALQQHASVHAAALALGLPSRYALYRLMKKWNITTTATDGEH